MAETLNKVWAAQIEKLLLRADYISNPRGQTTFESIGERLVIDMEHPLLTIQGRDLGYKFQAAEAWWILAGLDDVASIAPYSKEISKFSDDGERFFGAYGPKVVAQVGHVIQSLAKDDASRQAVINIWRESPPASKDIPCTLSLQFLLRAGELHCIATMRSSDVWLGLPYDCFNFTCIATYVLLTLNHAYTKTYTLGTLTMNLGSSHLYARDAAKVAECRLLGWKLHETCSWPLALQRDHVTTPAGLIALLKSAKDRPPGILDFVRA